MSDSDERIFNLIVFKLPLTNQELWGPSGDLPPFLPMVFVAIIVLVLLLTVLGIFS